MFIELIEKNLKQYGDTVDDVLGLLQAREFACYWYAPDETNLVALKQQRDAEEFVDVLRPAGVAR